MNDQECIKIIFVFDERNSQKFYPMRRNISLSTTINEIENMIASKHNITDRIIIKYKEHNRMYPINSMQTVGSIKDRIKDTKSGKIQYFIYVEIQPRNSGDYFKSESMPLFPTLNEIDDDFYADTYREYDYSEEKPNKRSFPIEKVEDDECIRIILSNEKKHITSHNDWRN